MDQNRRRLLISLGYGAASVATLGAIGALPDGRRPASPGSTGVESPPPPGLADSGIEVLGTTQTAPAVVAPLVLDPTFEAPSTSNFDTAIIGGG